MAMLMNSSTSSSPIHHNHRPKIHQLNRYNNNASQYYNQGMMTLRRPVNNQYYNDVGGAGVNLQRNVLQRPDVSGRK